ncbi:hypothetical protein AVEN_103044-1 [Araneus ventricosus]|uniref:Uncharacterized protein n=1 Tax=Araneus ventricosus TaxID=182803 RepID=A0A4Y2BBA4_ARAVE|nr:hypothetical protein AVEN_103044-1 [Araneus ventricosus]
MTKRQPAQRFYLAGYIVLILSFSKGRVTRNCHSTGIIMCVKSINQRVYAYLKIRGCDDLARRQSLYDIKESRMTELYKLIRNQRRPFFHTQSLFMLPKLPLVNQRFVWKCILAG